MSGSISVGKLWGIIEIDNYFSCDHKFWQFASRPVCILVLTKEKIVCANKTFGCATSVSAMIRESEAAMIRESESAMMRGKGSESYSECFNLGHALL